MPSFQEDAEAKMQWRAHAETRIAIGTRVGVVASDKSEYVGQRGTVIGYDVGSDGDWPLVLVRLDSGVYDGFYCDGRDDDEIKPSTEAA